jgi:hypothetical protein
MSMREKPWEVSDLVWAPIEPLLPEKTRRFRDPGEQKGPVSRAVP